jgi:hypothetical protein
MKKIGETTWTAEQTEALTRLWNSGLTAALIAPQVDFSRGAVLGKLSRLGLLKTRKTTMRPGARLLWPDEKVEELRRLCAKRSSLKEIAAVLEVSVDVARRKIRSLGLICVRARARARPVVWTDEKTALLRRLRDEGESLAKIAAACGVNETSVSGKVRSLGLPVRRYARPTIWTDEKVGHLRRLRMEGKTVEEAALALGVTPDAVRTKTRGLKRRAPSKRILRTPARDRARPAPADP